MTTRSALPQNYEFVAGTQFEDFETLADWTTTGTAEADAVNFRTGAKSLKLTAAAGSSATAKKTISRNFGGNPQWMELWAYCPAEYVANIDRLEVVFSPVSNLSRFVRVYTMPGYVWRAGWNQLLLPPISSDVVTSAWSRWALYSGCLWSETMILVKFNLYAKTGLVASLSLDNLIIGAQKRPSCLLTFDDGFRTPLDSGLIAHMDEVGARGTFYINPVYIGTNDAAYYTLAELQTMYAAGHAIANHCYNHTDLRTLDAAGITKEIADCADYLIANGMPRAAYHMAYPFGYNNSLVKETAAGIVHTIRGTSLTLFGDHMHLPVHLTASGTTTLDETKAAVDRARSSGQPIIVMFHEIVDSPSETNEWSTANAIALVDYAIESGLPCKSIDEGYNGLTNPRYRSLPVVRA